MRSCVATNLHGYIHMDSLNYGLLPWDFEQQVIINDLNIETFSIDTVTMLADKKRPPGPTVEIIEGILIVVFTTWALGVNVLRSLENAYLV